MARIRSVKPSFYRHELLQEIEVSNPSLKPMLVFSGLWTIADKEGRFEWRPKVIHLDVLPFIEFDMAETLGLLEKHGFICSYIIDGKRYGQVINFKDHQRITGREYDSESTIPAPPGDENVSPGSTGETPGKHPGAQEREEERERERERNIAQVLPSQIEEILSKWNRFAEGHKLPKVKGLPRGSSRERALLQRLGEKGFVFEDVLRAIHEQPFLYGDNDRGWLVTFDWILKPANLTKIIEGAYVKNRIGDAARRSPEDPYIGGRRS